MKMRFDWKYWRINDKFLTDTLMLICPSTKILFRMIIGNMKRGSLLQI
jgi:hypothetical protein